MFVLKAIPKYTFCRNVYGRLRASRRSSVMAPSKIRPPCTCRVSRAPAAKVQGIFKRRYSTDEIVCGDIKLDKIGHRVYKNGEEKSLNAKEYALILYLMENKDKVISKDELFNKIWGFDSDSEPQTLTVHIKWLREKLEDDPKKPVHIQTVWGVGYRFC